MTPEKKALIQAATRHLKLRDIALHDAQYLRPDLYPGDEAGIKAVQQHMSGAEYFISDQFNGEGAEKTLRVFVKLGIRIISEEAEPKTYLLIEATHVVVYDINGELNDDHLKVFAEFNAVHNVWPFWRQHVYDLVQRGRLPQLDVPLFAGLSL